jgi:hypothetical protein
LFSTGELGAKRLEFIEIVPGASIFGVLVNPKYPPAKNQAREIETAATKVGRTVYGVEASDDAQLETAFAALLQRGVAALVLASDPFFDSRRKRIISFAAENRLPGIYQFRDYALDGGLISYGPSITDTYRQVGVYVGRILKGANPSDLPIMLPTKYESGRQPQDRQSARPYSAADAAGHRRRGDRMRFFCCTAYVAVWHFASFRCNAMSPRHGPTVLHICFEVVSVLLQSPQVRFQQPKYSLGIQCVHARFP